MSNKLGGERENNLLNHVSSILIITENVLVNLNSLYSLHMSDTPGNLHLLLEQDYSTHHFKFDMILSPSYQICMKKD